MKGNQDFVGKTTKIEKSYKYKVNYLDIKLEDNKAIQISYPNSFFDAGNFLEIKNRDFLKYSLCNNKVSYIQNIRNNNTLDELYFSIQESNGFQIFISIALFIFNLIQLKKIRDSSSILKTDDTHLQPKTVLMNINDFTKRHSVLTFLIVVSILIFGYLVLNSVKQTQFFASNISILKYFILLSGLFIPLPFVIANYILLKKVKI